jgi:sulfate transport system substrate-binding protein
MKRGFFYLFAAFSLLAALYCLADTALAQKPRTLVLGAYTVPKEAYQKEIIPAFQAYWKQKTGQEVKFDESYVGSGAQARAIIGGFEADVAALSLEGDLAKVAEAGLITHDWKIGPQKGMITQSVVVIGYRAGNPKNLKDWDDLGRRGIEVIYPNPKTSGGAMWFVNAIYGAGLKLTETKTGKKDLAYAADLLNRVQANVKVMDKSGRESVTTFERGVGDAILTYENEALLRQMEGRDFPFLIPSATILIENPISMVDRNANKHGVRDLAEAFVQFCWTEQAQRSFAKFGLRPVLPIIAAEFKQKFPVPELLFDTGYLGGWAEIEKTIYGPNGVWTKAIEAAASH